MQEIHVIFETEEGEITEIYPIEMFPTLNLKSEHYGSKGVVLKICEAEYYDEEYHKIVKEMTK